MNVLKIMREVNNLTLTLENWKRIGLVTKYEEILDRIKYFIKARNNNLYAMMINT